MGEVMEFLNEPATKVDLLAMEIARPTLAAMKPFNMDKEQIAQVISKAYSHARFFFIDERRRNVAGEKPAHEVDEADHDEPREPEFG